jgi:hypothetical protein
LKFQLDTVLGSARWLGCSALLFTACVNSNALSKPSSETCDGSTQLQPGIPGSPGHLISTSLNPNGQSELALLMRRMTADLATVKVALSQTSSSQLEPQALMPAHRRMRCAWPTDPADRNATFDAMAVVYLRQVERFDAEKPVTKATYSAMVSACRACHENACPGPLAVIEKLEL